MLFRQIYLLFLCSSENPHYLFTREIYINASNYLLQNIYNKSLNNIVMPLTSIRSQSAMEYLMTYGWSILIIAVVLAALFSLGVFNLGASSTPNVCLPITGWQCNNMVLYASNTLSFTVGQIGQTIQLTGVACTATNTAPVSSLFSTISGSLGSAQTTTLSVSCPIPTGSPVGTKLTGYIWIQYTNSYGQSITTPIGRFVAQVSSTGSGPSAPTSTPILFTSAVGQTTGSPS